MKATLLFLLVTACFICVRVEWLNYNSGSPLPLWTTTNEEGFSRSTRLRYSGFADDRFWDEEIPGVRVDNREAVQRRAKNWNALLDFARPCALLQFPVLIGVMALLIKTKQHWKQPVWYSIGFTTLLLLSIAIYRDYSFGYYGM
jgi:hypothetical protein